MRSYGVFGDTRPFMGLCVVIMLLCAVAFGGAISEPVWSHRIGARLASAPVILGETVWIAKVRGGIEARSLVDGKRLLKLGTSGEVRISPINSDSLFAVREGRFTTLLILGNDPPCLLARIDTPLPIVDADAWIGGVAVLTTGSAIHTLRGGAWSPGRPLALAGPGWVMLEAVQGPAGEPGFFVGRRDGRLAAMVGSGPLHDGPELLGGPVEAVSRNGHVLLFGAEGRIICVGDNFTKIWSEDLGSGLQTPPVMIGNRAWCALRDKRLVLIDLIEGSVMACRELEGPLLCPLASTGFGVAYSSEVGKVVGLGAEPNEPAWELETEKEVAGIAVRGCNVVISLEKGSLSCYRITQLERD